MQFGLIGAKLGHSYSPMIHEKLASYSYELVEIPREALGDFLEKRDFQGLNVTIPYKKDVIPYCAELSEAAKEIGSVNTLIKRGDGTLYGHNTDLGGFIYMLQSAGIHPEGKKAVILGSGGTSLTAQASLRHLKAKEIIVVSRKGPVDYSALYAHHRDAEILINTTPVGMYPFSGVSPVDLSYFPHLCAVADVIYNPEKTALLLDAQERGIPVVSGLSMLVAQAREAAEFFSAASIAAEKVQDICAEIQSRTLNLVLVGMPGCGKSSIGEALSLLLDRPVVDSDELIARRAGMSVPDIFARFGEAHFRKLETEVLCEIGQKGGQIISTGGGAILRKENVRALRQNGRIALIRRPLNMLSRSGRPLSSSPEAVARLWEERKALYESCCDFIIDNTSTLSSAADQIKEAFYEAARH